MAEWSKALVLGTSHFDGVGSNPTTANRLFFPSFISIVYRHTGTCIAVAMCVCVYNAVYYRESSEQEQEKLL